MLLQLLLNWKRRGRSGFEREKDIQRGQDRVEVSKRLHFNIESTRRRIPTHRLQARRQTGLDGAERLQIPQGRVTSNVVSIYSCIEY